MKNVLIRGPLLNSAGYGVHSRQIFSYVESKKNYNISSQVTPWGICPFYLNETFEDGLIGRIINTSTPSDKKADVSFQIQLPNEWQPDAADFNIGITAGVETDRCSREWVDCVNAMDLVIVPSTHTKKSFENSGNIKTKIEIVPEYIQPAILEKKLEPMKLDLKTKFNFLMFGLITGHTPESDRKNTFYGIKWLCETFKDDKDVGVVIKTNLGRMSVIDRKDTELILRKLIDEVRVGDYPKVYLSHGMMTDHEVSSLYRSKEIQALVSFTRGEGYGLPLLEAAASGLPVMATKWSGHMDFLNTIRFSGFDYDIIDVHPSRIDDNVFISGCRWAHPKEKDTKKRLKKIKESYKVPVDWANSGAETLKRKLNPEKVFEIYDKVLQDILS
jgi:glycosyltransferase involved in cell wall biosynthesis